MKATQIKAADRFTDNQLHSMFVIVDKDNCEIKARKSSGKRASRAVTPRIDGEDNIRTEITDSEPGTDSRIEALRTFYASNQAGEVSAFTN